MKIISNKISIPICLFRLATDIRFVPDPFKVQYIEYALYNDSLINIKQNVDETTTGIEQA